MTVAALKLSVCDVNFVREQERITACESVHAALVEERKTRYEALDTARVAQQAARQAEAVQSLSSWRWRFARRCGRPASRSASDVIYRRRVALDRLYRRERLWERLFWTE